MTKELNSNNSKAKIMIIKRSDILNTLTPIYNLNEAIRVLRILPNSEEILWSELNDALTVNNWSMANVLVSLKMFISLYNSKK
jgi:hypothetical protein|tara:strand:- start:2285 stop:2533 length:249 start_codon:yes stop_codon:yes gene_type:complete